MLHPFQSVRRHDRCVSSTATRIYQLSEWLLISYSSLQPEPGDLLAHGKDLFRALLKRPQTLSNLPNSWQILVGVVVLVVIKNYESRSSWLSLFLYVVIFPQSVARTKCFDGTQLTPTYGINVQISVVSYLTIFLLYFKPLASWTPSPSFIISTLGHTLSPLNPYISLVHVQVLQLLQALAGSSLNTIELSLLAHVFTVFTVYYLEKINTSDEIPMNETFFITFIYGLMLAVWLSGSFLRKNVRLAKIRPHHRPKDVIRQRFSCAIYTYMTITVFIMTVVRAFLRVMLEQDPFIFMLSYLLADWHRIALILYWLCVSGAGIFVVIYFWGSKPVGGLSGFGQSARRLFRHSRENDMHKAVAEDDVFFAEEDTLARRARALDRRRKFFHGLVVVLFLPTMNRDPRLSYLAFSLALTALLFEELLRITALPPFGVAIHKFLSGFTDHRDEAGHVVVSHLFLLIGVASPVWLTLTGAAADIVDDSYRENCMAMLSGVLTLGAGDAAASIVGKKYGKHKWPGLQKSFEGTVAFIIAMSFGGFVTARVSQFGTTIDWPRFLLGVCATGIMEAVSTQNDNLIIPVFMWCFVYR